MSFSNSLQFGLVAEGFISKWLMLRGSVVVPAYQVEQWSGKGPQVFASERSYVAPDMLCFGSGGALWIEAKHKSVFTWYYKHRKWTTGIDRDHYEQYKYVSERTRIPVWLLFFHSESTPTEKDRWRGAPSDCPTGLFGQSLLLLDDSIDHTAPPHDVWRDQNQGHGRSGMVYWAHEDLRLLATKDEVFDAARQIDERWAFARGQYR